MTTPRHASVAECRRTAGSRARGVRVGGADRAGRVSVVLVTQRRSDDALYHALVEDPGDVEGVFRVGDCVAPRMLADAIFDGHRLAREIDGDDPAVARVWQRERV